MPPHGRNRRGRDVEGLELRRGSEATGLQLVRTGPLGVGNTTEEATMSIDDDDRAVARIAIYIKREALGGSSQTASET